MTDTYLKFHRYLNCRILIEFELILRVDLKGHNVLQCQRGEHQYLKSYMRGLKQFFLDIFYNNMIFINNYSYNYNNPYKLLLKYATF